MIPTREEFKKQIEAVDRAMIAKQFGIDVAYTVEITYDEGELDNLYKEWFEEQQLQWRDF